MKQKRCILRGWHNFDLRFLFVVSCLLFIVSLHTAYAIIGIDEPLIPCGTEITTAGGKTTITNPCTFCHFFVLIQNVYNFLIFIIAPPIAVVLVAIGGFLWLTAGGSERRVKKGTELLLAVLVGLVIVYVSWLLISFGIKLIARDITHYDPAVWNDPTSWFDPECAII